MYRFTVKHGTQNIQNDFHQQLSHSIRVLTQTPQTVLGALLLGGGEKGK